MKTERTTRECAEIFLTTLRQGKALGRQDILARGLLNAREADRAIKSLSAAGTIRRSVLSQDAEPRAVRYEPTEAPIAQSRRRPAKISKPGKVCFDGLLTAWRIHLPHATQQSGRYAGFVNDAFAREEQRELAALRKATWTDEDQFNGAFQSVTKADSVA